MAGIKRKSAGGSAPEVKDKSKKVKVDKSASKTKLKHEVKPVKPVKKAKKAKEESSDIEESDTSEQDNGFYGFSAADGEDVQMSDAESNEEAEETNGKTQKPKNESDGSKKPKGDGVESKLAGLNGKTRVLLQLMPLVNCNSSKQLTGSACETKSPSQRTQGREAQCGHH